jgi:hypothetical protein
MMQNIPCTGRETTLCALNTRPVAAARGGQSVRRGSRLPEGGLFYIGLQDFNARR